MTGPAARALVLDCDGVLADTERYGHLAAFNQTFAEFGLPVRWTVADYQEKVRIGGGKERMASLLTPEFVAAAGLPGNAAGQQDAIAAWHRRKTAIYAELVAAGAVPPRPGIARIVAEALAAGWPVAVASTSAEPSVRVTLDRAVGTEIAREVRVFAGDIVSAEEAGSRYLPARPRLTRPARRSRGRRRGFKKWPAGRHRRRPDLHDHCQRLHRGRRFQRGRPGRFLAG